MNTIDQKYEYMYHIADAKFKAYGNTIEEAFENAALAMFNVMIDTAVLRAEVERLINVTSSDIKMLLVEWLSELLYLFEVEEIIFCEFKIDRIEKEKEGFSLTGRASGAQVNPGFHKFDTQIKGVTLHELEADRDDSGQFYVQVVVDT